MDLPQRIPGPGSAYAARISALWQAVVRTCCAQGCMSLRLLVPLETGARCMNMYAPSKGRSAVNLFAKNTTTASSAMAKAIGTGMGSRYG